MKKLLTLGVALLIPVMILGQSSGKISGTVTDEDGNALAGANVIVVGTSSGAASGDGGDYFILAVPAGTYSLRVDFIGYKSVIVSNVIVSGNLTTDLDFSLVISAIEGETVEIVAERPIINKSATNTTRVVGQDVIQNVAVRGVENLVGLQTGAVSHGGAIYVRGGRSGDMAYYVDGVYTVNPFSLSNTGVVSNNAMEQISFQSGGFDAAFGNSNGGMVNTITRIGGENLTMGAEYVMDLGADASTKKDELHSYGYNLLSFNVGGPFGDNIRYFGSFERVSYADASPSTSYYPAVTRTTHATDSLASAVNNTVFTERLIDLNFDSNGIVDPSLSDTSWVAYSDYKRLYGKKPNAGLTRDLFSGNIVLDMKPLKIKVGGSFSNKDSRGDIGESVTISQGDYPYTYTLLNSDNTPWYTSSTMSGYANFTYSLGASSYAKANLSYYDYNREYGDDRHKDDILAYGDPTVAGNEQLIAWGGNPLAVDEFAYFTNYGVVYDEYRKSHMSYLGLKADYVNQMGNHELKGGFEWRKHTLRDYRLAQPMEISQNYQKARLNNYGPDGEAGTADDYTSSDANYIDVNSADWLYTTYRNAYTMNIGYDQEGNEADSYNMSNGTSPPGEPTIMGAYVQDKIELEDLILNVGVRFDRFDFGSEAPASWDALYLSNGRIDHTASGYSKVDAYTYISPRFGVSFPVTDKTVLHAQYGKFVQHPILNRLYLSDTRFAANQTQGNMVESPNGSLKPERTIQYEIGFAQQLGGFAAIDLTGYYKEVRDYTMLSNRSNATIDGAEFSWAQFSNGDYGVVKGLSAALKMRRLNGVLIDVNYTYQTANGTGSDPSSNFMIAWIGENYPKSINPLDYDQRHTGSVMMDFQAGRIAGLFNLNLNATYQFGSGTAYTPSTLQSAVFGRGWYEPVSSVNSGFQPWTSMMDLRINFGNIAGRGVSAYILVLNALNTENVVSVYPGTGSAGEDGWLNTSEGEVWLKGNPIGESFYEDRLRNPSRWQNPRMIRVGVAYSL